VDASPVERTVAQRRRSLADTLSLRFADAPPLRVSSWHSSTSVASRCMLIQAMKNLRLRCSEVRRRLGSWRATRILITDASHPQRRGKHWHLFNPGSVGVPLDGIHQASYMLLDGDANGWEPTFRRVPFDYTTLFHEFERGNFVQECGVTGHLVLREFETARVQVHPFLQWRKAFCPDAPLSVELLKEFDKVDVNEYALPAYRIV
jgi:diadenosine tetraphosphatase ApaH/serine/threonine PP2A family protein phosphatase